MPPTPEVRHERARLLLLIHTLIGVLVIGAGIGVGETAEVAWLTPLCVGMTVLYGWLIGSWVAVRGSLFNPYGFFLLLTIAFNGGYALLHLFDGSEQIYLLAEFDPAALVPALYLIALSLLGLHAGALLSCATESEDDVRSRHVEETASLRAVGWGMLAISAFPMALYLRDALAVAAAGGYMELHLAEAAGGGAMQTLLNLAALFFLPAPFFLLAGSRDHRWGRYVSLLAILLFAALHLVLGVRRFVLFPLLAYAWLWHRSVCRLPLAPLSLAGSVLLFIVFPLVAEVRTLPGGAWQEPGLLLDTFFSIENPLLEALAEVSGSIVTVLYTLDLVPEARPFGWGIGYLVALLAAVPMLRVESASLSGWLIRTVKPEWAALGGGLGFSFIAEAYLNFGWFGAPLVLLLMGYGTLRLVRHAERAADPAKLAAVACFTASFLFLARAETLDLARPLLWYALLPYLAVVVLRRASAKSPARTITHPPIPPSIPTPRWT